MNRVLTAIASLTRRQAVIALAVIAGVSGEVLAAVSMTRIAGDSLGFPELLTWTLFAVVSVAGWVGAALWTSDNPDDHALGRALNLPAAVIAGVFVGLDHAQHAATGGQVAFAGFTWWQVIAFTAGPLITLVSSVMLHVIAKTGDRARVAVAETVEAPKQVERRPESAPQRSVADAVADLLPADTQPIPAVPAVDDVAELPELDLAQRYPAHDGETMMDRAKRIARAEFLAGRDVRGPVIERAIGAGASTGRKAIRAVIEEGAVRPGSRPELVAS